MKEDSLSCRNREGEAIAAKAQQCAVAQEHGMEAQRKK